MRRMRWVVGAADVGRLDAVTLRCLSQALGRPLSKSIVRRLVMAGAVRVDGRPARRPGLVVHVGARLEAQVDEARLPAETAAATAGPVHVLYEDEALIAIAKPAGLPMHASADNSRADLFTAVRRHLAERAGSSDDALPYLGLHHRLDRDTSGVVIFTKAEAANAGLASQFADRAVEKVYHAVTVIPSRAPEARWRVSDRLGQAGSGSSSRTARVTTGGQVAQTSFAILERFRSGLLVEARPHTGRKHQVRAHLAGCGIPIVGDARYGGPTRLARLPVPRPMLHARSLSLVHPLSGEPLEIRCGYPDDFRLLLEHLRAH